MKNLIYISFILMASLLSANEIILEENPKAQFIGVSAGLLSSLDCGFGSIYKTDKFTKEKLVGFRYGQSEKITAIGIYGKNNYFKSPHRLGMFYRTNVGVDYILMPEGHGYGTEKLLFFNLSVGIGYSLKVSSLSQFRVSINVGLMAILAAINIEFAF